MGRTSFRNVLSRVFQSFQPKPLPPFGSVIEELHSSILGQRPRRPSMWEGLEEIDTQLRTFLQRKTLRDEARYDEQTRRLWIRSRLWYHGPHRRCCAKCFQLGFAWALHEADRHDLLAQYPSTQRTFEEFLQEESSRPGAQDALRNAVNNSS